MMSTTWTCAELVTLSLPLKDMDLTHGPLSRQGIGWMVTLRVVVNGLMFKVKASDKCVSGSALVLMLFDTFVSDMDRGTKRSLSKFVNYTKS